MSGAKKNIPLLLKKLREETAFISSTTQIKAHPAYESILLWGRDAVPLLLARILEKPTWVPLWALMDITDGISVPSENLGRLYAITYLWIKWGYANGYISLHSSTDRIKDS